MVEALNLFALEKLAKEKMPEASFDSPIDLRTPFNRVAWVHYRKNLA